MSGDDPAALSVAAASPHVQLWAPLFKKNVEVLEGWQQS